MNEEREYWLQVMKRIVDPVLINLSRRNLKKNMKVKGERDRKEYAYLEALGRTAAGIAPWLELAVRDENISNDEQIEIDKYADMARESVAAGVDPDSADYMIFDRGGQPLVDAAFLAHAIVRAPVQLWQRQDDTYKNFLITALKSTRKIKPCYSNWLLFTAMIETALYVMGEDFDIVRIDYALKEHENWYLGDGTYGDGPQFHWDYYNSFVIQPMLIDIIKHIADLDSEWSGYQEIFLHRAQRYAEILERLIAPDGSFPPLGRSLAYRFGVFQLLSQLALEGELPEALNPAQVRSALSAVIRKVINIPDTFDEQGWINIGFCGHQPDIAEGYITTGSLYLCSTVFLPLGLQEQDQFWQGKDREWTSKKIWSGKNCGRDQALDI